MIHNFRAFATAFFVLALSNSAESQQMFRCKSPSGKVEFTDAPCTVGHASEALNIRNNANVLDGSGSRELVLRKENQELKDRLNAQQAQASPNPAASQKTQSDLQSERIDTIACERARRDLEVTSSSTSNSSAIIEAKRSAMYGTCGMREPSRTTLIVNPVLR
jgi:hypothetical protein